MRCNTEPNIYVLELDHVPLLDASYYNLYDTAYESESHMKHGDVRAVLGSKKAEHERITSLSLILLYKDID